jgi:DNA-binding NtrC family response regulator
MKSGAFDYVVKPLEESRLITAVKQALSFKELKRENLALKECILSDTLDHPEAFADIITNNKKMLSLFRYVETIASTSQPVLITGETGVGKELIARAIHKVSGFTGPFTPVNVAGLDDHTFSDTLFGHVKGAFTGADRDRSGLVEHTAGGTLLLDEIGDLNNSSQVKLLRLLQEGEYLPLGSDNPKYSNARILTATNQDLWHLQEKGTFRKDLFYRLGTYHIHVPPVRERMDDVPLLVENFLEEAAHTLNKKKPTPPKELFTLLNTYGFPGNVRELRAMAFDAVSRHTTKMLSLEVFKSYIKKEGEKLLSPDLGKNDDTVIMFPGKLPTIKQATELLVEEAMNRSKGNQSVAAQILGISQPALSKRLKKQAEHL